MDHKSTAHCGHMTASENGLRIAVVLGKHRSSCKGKQARQAGVQQTCIISMRTLSRAYMFSTCAKLAEESWQQWRQLTPNPTANMTQVLNKFGSSCIMKLVLWQELTILPLTHVATHRKGLSPLQAEGRLRSLAQVFHGQQGSL